MSPLRQSQGFIDLLQQTRNPVLGILVGVIFTAIIQSSSVTTGILIILGQQGLLGIESALPIFLKRVSHQVKDENLPLLGKMIAEKKYFLLLQPCALMETVEDYI